MGYLKQTIISDSGTGEVVYDRSTVGSRNGNGWVLMFTEETQKLIINAPNPTVLKVFMLLACGQGYGDNGSPFGMITSKKAVQEKLNISKPTCLNAFTWLKENFVIHELRVDGHTEFMINPVYISVGRDKSARMKEWVARFNANPTKRRQRLPKLKVPVGLEKKSG